MSSTDTVSNRPRLEPPKVEVLKSSESKFGLIFIDPKAAPGTNDLDGQEGLQIIDERGRTVWFKQTVRPDTPSDFRVQHYRGESVLTYTIGQSTGGPGHSEGHDVILDRHYHEIATVRAANGMHADQHEFLLTPEGTALISIYHPVPYDLSPFGGPADGRVFDGVIQEIDVESAKVLFEWHSLDHVSIEESYQEFSTDPGAEPHDYFHINAINPDLDGNLLVSARQTWTVYKLDRKTGDVIWRLGGKQSDFELDPEVPFAWQHNALPDGPRTVRIFDNEGNFEPVRTHPRVIEVKLDLEAMTASLVNSIEHDEPLFSGSQGNAQRLPDGHLFIGWGEVGRISEFSAEGELVLDLQLPPGYDTYRAYRSPWVGIPDEPPLLSAVAEGERTVLEASWNGATEVARWRLLAGADLAGLVEVAEVEWAGLATEIEIQAGAALVKVLALNDSGREIGSSAAVSVKRDPP